MGPLADFDRAIALQPDFAQALNNRGSEKDLKRDYAGALADYDRAIQVWPNFAEAFYNRGNVKAKKQNYRGALADFDRAIAFKPDYADAYDNRGQFKVRKTRLHGGDLRFRSGDSTPARQRPRFQWSRLREERKTGLRRRPGRLRPRDPAQAR
jgi:tetratricopeptide (TPR) repeat protein